MNTSYQTLDASESVVDSVNTLSGTISDYGIMIVICSLMIIIFAVGVLLFAKNYMLTVKASADQNSQLLEEIINENKALKDKFMEMQEASMNIHKQVDNTNRKPHTIDMFVELNTVLKGTCKNIQENLEAGRSAVYVFHNGSVASHGLPFFKLTCVSEWISRGKGFNARISIENNLSLNIFSPIVEEILYNNKPIVYTLEKSKEEPILYSWLSSNDVSTCIIQGIYSSIDNTPMGYLSVEYKSNIDIEETKMNLIKSELKTACLKCAPVLEFSKANKI